MSDVPASRDEGGETIETLGRRVRWLDRYRRVTAIGIVILMSPWFLAELGEGFGHDWPPIHIAFLAMMLGSIAWWLVECVLAGITATWETKLEWLRRERELPRAELLRRRVRR